MSFDVRLLKNHNALFPNRCIGCGFDAELTKRFSVRTMGWLTPLAGPIGSPFRVDVPICDSCRWQVNSQRIFRWATVIVIVAMVVWIAMPLLANVDRQLRYLLILGIGFVCLTPLMLWESLFPPIFDLMPYKKTVTYQFRNRQYAHEFSQLNQDAVVSAPDDSTS